MHDGVEQYKAGNYVAADSIFNESAKNEKATSVTTYNQAAAQLKQQKYKEAQAGFEAYTQSAESDEERSKGFLGLGNTKLEQKDPSGAIEAYKKAIATNPDNNAAKYNLSYAYKMLQQQQQQQDQKKDDKKEDKKEDKEQQQDDKKDEKDKEEKNQDKQDDQKEDKEQKKQQQEQQKKQEEFKKQNAERLLDALNEEEQKIQKQVKEGKGKKTDINIEKDW